MCKKSAKNERETFPQTITKDLGGRGNINQYNKITIEDMALIYMFYEAWMFAEYSISTRHKYVQN